MRRWISVVFALPLGAALAAACGSPSPYWQGGDVDVSCREEPGECDGDIGGACVVTEDCFDGFCCTDKNCGDGMCTYRCDSNADCPETMLCEHDVCFFACNSDGDCGPGQRCEHGETICEYEGGD